MDSPSGTTLALAKTLIQNIEQKTTIKSDNLEGAISPSDLCVSSMRCGSDPGTHSIIMDSPVDTITLTHKTRQRDGLAIGALHAALWLKGKTGFFHISDMIKELMNRENLCT